MARPARTRVFVAITRLAWSRNSTVHGETMLSRPHSRAGFATRLSRPPFFGSAATDWTRAFVLDMPWKGHCKTGILATRSWLWLRGNRTLTQVRFLGTSHWNDESVEQALAAVTQLPPIQT